MKKVLILTYFFSPSNFAGSYRMTSFAKYLNKYGYYPIVITRQSSEGANSLTEMAKDHGTEVLFEQHDGYEVYYLPYKGNLRDRIFAKYGEKKFSWLRKFLSFFELVLQGVTVKVIPYANLYYFARKYLRKNADIDFIFCSGKPYQLFLFASLLSEEFGVRWIADYRDEWNSRYKYNNFELGLKQKFFYFYDTFLERKWIKNATLITTVTEDWAVNLSVFLNKPCKVVLNGYDHELINNFISEEKSHGDNKEFVIVHLGSLYEYQPIEIFIEAVINLLKKDYKVLCYFPGVTIDPLSEPRIRNLTHAFPEAFIIMPRINQREALKLMCNSDALLMVGYQNVKGWMSSKVLEYLPMHKPIILCPGDNGLLEALLKPYSKTHICNSVSTLEKTIVDLYKNRKSIKSVDINDEIYVNKFTREKQVEILSNYLNEL